MAGRITRGIIAGAAGTTALDTVTYLDMALRGRPSSSTPSTVAGILAEKIGLTSLAPDQKDDATSNKRSGFGALMGYAAGVGVGMLYGLVRGEKAPPGVLSGVVVGLAAMAASDLPIALTGASDPTTWSPTDWLSDLVPHLVYGVVVAETYAVLSSS